jgi:hypothetical protein
MRWSNLRDWWAQTGHRRSSNGDFKNLLGYRRITNRHARNSRVVAGRHLTTTGAIDDDLATDTEHDPSTKGVSISPVEIVDRCLERIAAL